MNKPSDAAMRLIDQMHEVETCGEAALLVDAAVADYKRVLGTVMQSLCGIKDLSNQDHMARARSLALGAIEAIAELKDKGFRYGRKTY